MRKTGKYWNLTVACITSTLVASILVANWSDSSHRLHLWLDIVPSGFGIAAVITTTLIGLISSVDRELVAVATGREHITSLSFAKNH